jgi:hypothetical protein
LIVKIQWPVTTTEKVPQMLIYNKDRSFQTTWPATEEYKQFFKNRLKFYVHAKFKKGELILGKEEKDPKLIDW